MRCSYYVNLTVLKEVVQSVVLSDTEYCNMVCSEHIRLTKITARSDKDDTVFYHDRSNCNISLFSQQEITLSEDQNHFL